MFSPIKCYINTFCFLTILSFVLSMIALKKNNDWRKTRISNTLRALPLLALQCCANVRTSNNLVGASLFASVLLLLHGYEKRMSSLLRPFLFLFREWGKKESSGWTRTNININKNFFFVWLTLKLFFNVELCISVFACYISILLFVPPVNKQSTHFSLYTLNKRKGMQQSK